MEYSTKHRRQERKNTGIVISQRVLFYKLDLLTNGTVVDDAIRFVSTKSKENLKSSTEGDKEESKEPDYDEMSDKVGEERQEQETGEITINRVF